MRDQNIDQLLQMTQDVLKSRTTEEWLARLEAEGVPCAPVLTRDQVIAHPQVLASGILMESDHEAVGRIRQTRAATRFSDAHQLCASARRAEARRASKYWPSWASSAATSRPCRAGASSDHSDRRRPAPDPAIQEPTLARTRSAMIPASPTTSAV